MIDSGVKEKRFLFMPYSKRNPKYVGPPKYGPRLDYARVAAKLAEKAFEKIVRGTGSSRGGAATETKGSGPNLVGGNDETIARTVWKKKKLSKKAKKWKRIKTKRAKSIAIKNAAPRTVVFNGREIGVVRNQQDGLYCLAYGANGDGGTDNVLGNRDLRLLCDREPSFNETAEKIIIGSCRLSCTFTNCSVHTLECDIYEVTFYDKGHTFKNPNEMSFRAYNDIPEIPGFTGLSLENRGVTLFDMPHLKKLGMYVQKFSKAILAPGASILHNAYFSKSRTIGVRDVLKAQDQLASPERFVGSIPVKCWYVIYKPTREITEAVPGGVEVTCTRKYVYRVVQANNQGEGYFGPTAN